jgi:predicted RNA-binding Zn ribbon-like protein
MTEPLPIAFANTVHAVRGRVLDDLETTGQLAGWLRGAETGLPRPPGDLAVGEAELRQARELRDAIRAIITAVVAGRAPEPAHVTVVNTAAREAPRWRELHWEPEPRAVTRTAGTPVAAALSMIAGATVDLLAGDLRHEVRACHAPGCVLHFVRDNPRREWCSAGCGNRARAARHYAKTRQDG